jgi:GH35 family endo-1,4-beta-xylanase
MQVVGHTLLWHSQIPQWQQAYRTSGTREDALRDMRDSITRIVTHFKGRVYLWDVLNEVFPDGGYHAGSDWRQVMRTGTQGNPWYMRIGYDFVYEGFLAARLADPDVILYYNDYNLNMVNKATMVRDMVRDINQQYLNNLPAIRAANPGINLDRTDKLIEGIGMQGHHNTGITAASIRASLNLFRPLGVEIAITELDVLSQTWGEYSSNAIPTEAGQNLAADLYGQFFTVFLDNADIIERVTFWGVYDEQSWRARALPLIFTGRSVSYAKPAYFRIIEALENRQ